MSLTAGSGPVKAAIAPALARIDARTEASYAAYVYSFAEICDAELWLADTDM